MIYLNSLYFALSQLMTVDFGQVMDLLVGILKSEKLPWTECEYIVLRGHPLTFSCTFWLITIEINNIYYKSIYNVN